MVDTPKQSDILPNIPYSTGTAPPDPFTLSANRFASGLGAAGVIGTLSNCYGAGTTFSVVTAEPQAILALASNQIVRGVGGPVVAGADYGITIKATHPSDPTRFTITKFLTECILSNQVSGFPSDLISGGTPTPTPTPAPTDTAVWLDNDYGVYPDGDLSDTDNTQALALAPLFPEVSIKGISNSFNPTAGWQLGKMKSYFNLEYRNNFATLEGARPGHQTPDELIARCYQGATAAAPSAGWSGSPTEASTALIASARLRTVAKPLYICVGGPFTNLAQAIHDAPDIVDKIVILAVAFRSNMYNGSADLNAFNYINGLLSPSGLLKDTTFVAINDTLYGMSPGADGAVRDTAFVTASITGKGEIGEFLRFSCDIDPALSNVPKGFRWGDGPALLYVTDNIVKKGLADPTVAGGWGGQYQADPSRGNKFYIDIATGQTVNSHPGANTVLQYRTAILADIAARYAEAGSAPSATAWASWTSKRGNFDPNGLADGAMTTFPNLVAGGGDLTYAGAAGAVVNTASRINGRKGAILTRNITSQANLPRFEASKTDPISQMFQGQKPFTAFVCFKPTDTNTGYIMSASRTIPTTDYEAVVLISRNANSTYARQPATPPSDKNRGLQNSVAHASTFATIVGMRWDGYAMKYWRTGYRPYSYASLQDQAISDQVIFRLFAEAQGGASDPTLFLAQRSLEFYRGYFVEEARKDVDIAQLLTDWGTDFALTIDAGP